MTTERIKIELSEDQVTFLGRLRNLSASEFIVGLVDRAMREEWVINHGGGRVGAHNWEGWWPTRARGRDV